MQPALAAQPAVPRTHSLMSMLQVGPSYLRTTGFRHHAVRLCNATRFLPWQVLVYLLVLSCCITPMSTPPAPILVMFCHHRKCCSRVAFSCLIHCAAEINVASLVWRILPSMLCHPRCTGSRTMSIFHQMSPRQLEKMWCSFLNSDVHEVARWPL